MISAIGSATTGIAAINTSPISVEIAAIERQITVYQKQLQSQSITTQQSQLINAQITQLDLSNGQSISGALIDTQAWV